MSYTILKHGTVVTVDKKRRIIEDGAVVILGDRIVAIADTADIINKYGDQAHYIDCQKTLILPGLIDVHAHAGHSLFSVLGIGRRSSWMKMMTELYHHNTTDRFWYNEGRLAALTRLKYGVTCGLNVLSNCQRSDRSAIALNQARAYYELGMRNVIAVGPSNPPFPRTFSQVLSDGSKLQTDYSFDQLMQTAEDTIGMLHHANDDCTRVFIAPFVLVPSVNASGQTAPDSAITLTSHDIYMMKCVRQVAKNKKTRIHTEAFGNMIKLASQSQYALLGPDCHLQHCMGISLEEAKLLADTHTHVSSTPDADQFIERCPVPELMTMGANVAISTDGSAPCGTFDLVDVSRKNKLVHEGFLRDRYYFPEGKMLEMITIDAAKALGWDDQIGSLEVGKKADIIVVDLNKPHLTPQNMPLQKWLLMGSGNDVRDVFVNGEWVIRNRTAVKADENAIISAAEVEYKQTIERANMLGMAQQSDTFWRSTRVTFAKRYEEIR